MAAVTIWNPDGSQAEMSGNGTRIAARWLAERTGETTVHLGSASERSSRGCSGETRSSRSSARYVVGARERGRRLRRDHARRRRQPARRRRSATRPSCRRSAQRSSRIRAFRSERTCRSRASTRRARSRARVWERGVGETSASGTSAIAVAAATHGEGDVVVHFPAATSTCGSPRDARTSAARPRPWTNRHRLARRRARAPGTLSSRWAGSGMGPALRARPPSLGHPDAVEERRVASEQQLGPLRR